VVVGLFILVMIPAVAGNVYYRNSDKAFGFGVAVQRFPIEAMVFARDNDLPEPVLNNLGDGGYLIFEGGPRSVYSDGRLEVYGGERVEQAVRLFQTGAGFDEVVAGHNIRTVLLRHSSDQGLMRLIEERPNWRPVYFDSQYVIYVRETAETAGLVERLAFDWQEPKRFEPVAEPAWLPPALLSGVFPAVTSNREDIVLGELFLNVGNLEQALAYFDEATELAPVNDTVRFYRGVIYRAKGEERIAADIFDELDESYLKQGAVHILAATIYEAAGNNRAAIIAYQQGLELGLRTETNYQALIRLGLAEKDYLTAVTALVELAQLRPEEAGIWNELGLVYLEVGDLERARRAFEQALVVDPDFLPAFENLEAMGPQ
jgi:Flp pilus assembly protein TadD